jgi:AcrR family transcriptional regulator
MKQTYHHKDLKRELIEKGIELVSTEGLQSFSLRKVAAACQVTHAAPYAHFQNKDELLDAMQNHITDEFTKMLESTIAEYADNPDILDHLGMAYILFFIDNPHYFSFLFEQSNMRIDLSFSGESTLNYKPFEIYKGIALKATEQAAFPEERKNDAIIALWAFIHGIASLATMKNVIYDEDWKSKIHDIICVLRCPGLLGKQEMEG